MINLQSEINKSKEYKSTQKLLQDFVFSVVEESLTNVYGENYSIRCLQSSLGIQKILKEFGINSSIQIGSCCFSVVEGTNPYQIVWGGFWDKDHHVWLLSEYFEIIDFTVSKLHLHPFRNGKNLANPIPPIWWAPASIAPPIFKYLPNKLNINLVPKLEEEENNELLRYFDKLDEIKSKKLKLLEEGYVPHEFEALTGIQKLNELYESGNNWLNGSLIIQEQRIPFPDWIIEKEKELFNHHK